MTRRQVHGDECRCDSCRAYYAGGRADLPRLPKLPAMPTWQYALAYALIQVGDYFKVMAIRASPAEPSSAEPADDEDDIARRAASGEYNR